MTEVVYFARCPEHRVDRPHPRMVGLPMTPSFDSPSPNPTEDDESTPTGRKRRSGETRDGTPLTAVRMTEGAADALADACRVAYGALFDELEVEGRISLKKDEAMEWLDWASRWLKRPDARSAIHELGEEG